MHHNANKFSIVISELHVNIKNVGFVLTQNSFHTPQKGKQYSREKKTHWEYTKLSIDTRWNVVVKMWMTHEGLTTL